MDYEWPEPTALQSTTNPNQTVKLHSLCTVCQRLVDEFQNIGMSRDELNGLSVAADYSAEHRHYRSILELAASSERGCHLCSILWAELQGWPSTLESLRLLESQLQAAFEETQDTVPHSYAFTVDRGFPAVDSAQLILRYPPDAHGSGESEKVFSVLSSGLMHQRWAHIASITMNTIPSEDFPEFEDSATVSSASDRSFSLASSWLCDCLANHRLCNQIADANFPPPTRVIEIEFHEGKFLPRLYLTSIKDSNMKYIALSHCWGQTKILVLMEHMLESMTHGIDWLRLPRTFQDAIIVTRRLGFRYLWIDSLCIIQDSHEDWIRESETMQNVYANCVLTIAASWGGDGSTGLFVERNPLNQQPCRLFRNAYTGVLVQPRPTDFRRKGNGMEGLKGVHLYPENLDKRAWAVQERFLPARTLSYKSFELHWDCFENHGSESWPTGLRSRAKNLVAMGLPKEWYTSPENNAFREINLLKTPSGGFDLEYMRDFYPHWNNILEIYTRAQLTFQSDVFVAVSGITKRIEKWTGLTNVFGMWMELLPMDLLWEPLSPAFENTRSALCPTWSWASRVGMKVRMIFAPMGDNLLANDNFDERYPALIKARILSLEPLLAAPESLMRIQIQGPVFCAKILRRGGPRVNYTLEGKAEVSATIDSPGELAPDEDKFFLLVVERGDPETAQEIFRIGLILARLECEKEDYIRLGVWTQRLLIGENLKRKAEDLALNAEEKTIFLI